MKIVNYTPWPALGFESATPDDRLFGVLVLRGTFRIVPGAPLRPIPDQAPVALESLFRGPPATSSLRSEADLAPYKNATDIHIDAIARAPKGTPAPEWPVRVRVGKLTKDLLIRGPHAWYYRRPFGWKLARPEPCTEVELSYENAFGGTFGSGPDRLSDDRNPVGTGWLPPEAPRDAPIRAPQVLAADEPEHQPGKRYTPQGVGPLLPGWEPRLSRAGTFDDAWRETQWPNLPLDFRYCHYNSAHPDLVYPGFVTGGEPIELVNLSAKPIHASLPRYGVYAIGYHAGGVKHAFSLVLDTVHIDVRSPNEDEHRVSLVWRGRFPTAAIEALEIRMRDLSREVSREDSHSRSPEGSSPEGGHKAPGAAASEVSRG